MLPALCSLFLRNNYFYKSAKMKKILFCLILLRASIPGWSQSHKSAERIWLIDYYFMAEPQFQDELTRVDANILLGKYDAAKGIIQRLKNGELKDRQRSALLCYEANILYNESDYRRSIELCDEALSIMQNASIKNRYWVKASNMKAKGLGALNEYDEAQRLVEKNLQFARSIKDENGEAACLYYLGSFYSDKGNYKRCADYMHQSVRIRKKIDDQIGLAASYAFLGLSYSYMDDYIRGIEYVQKSILIRERIKDKRGLANSYLTLYKVYSEIGEIDKAMESEFRSLSICSELKDLQCVSGRYTNIGQIYQKKGNDERALYYHFKALGLSRKLEIKNRMALVYENIARVYRHQRKFDLALSYLDSSEVLRIGIKDEVGLANVNLIKADIRIEQGKPQEAIDHSLMALHTGEKLRLPHIIKEAHDILHKGYAAKGKDRSALDHFEKYVWIRDSIFNIDQSKELLRKELEFNFNKKREMERLEETKRREHAKMESKRQQSIILYTISALAVVSLLLAFSIWQYRQKNRSKKALEVANELIQEKNREITDSIRYAHQIQTAILPAEQEFRSHFSDAFVLFRPKDIISGDFYWVTKLEEKVIYATADCTGHGVPGGFMSMLGMSMLNELINEYRLTDPAEILNRLRDKVIAALKQKGVSGEQQDGMDMTLMVLDLTHGRLTFALANHVFYLLRQGELKEFKGDKFPVGIYGDGLREFRNQTIDVQKGDQIFTFSDGFADQFGGPKGKKLKYKKMQEYLLQCSVHSSSEIRTHLEQAFDSWKGDHEQLDDVCVIGVRV